MASSKLVSFDEQQQAKLTIRNWELGMMDVGGTVGRPTQPTKPTKPTQPANSADPH